LPAFCSIRSERQLVERIDHNLLFRWFVGRGIEDPMWMPPPPPRTATGCSKAMWQLSFSPPCWAQEEEILGVTGQFVQNSTLTRCSLDDCLSDGF